MIHIYCDGACKGNQNKENTGSYAFVAVKEGNVIHQQAKVKFDTTNNVMELMGAISALEWCKDRGHKQVTVYTDSKYLYHGITDWIHNWKRKGWRKADKSPVTNRELWEQLDSLISHSTHWVHVYGHRDNQFNNLADKLCNDVINQKV